MKNTLSKIIKFGVTKTIQQISSERKMLGITKNVWENRNPTYTREKLQGICRVSFKQTYGEIFKGNLDEIWEVVKGQKRPSSKTNKTNDDKN